MISHSQRLFLLVALCNLGPAASHESPWNPRNLFKRIDYAPPPGGWGSVVPPGGWSNPAYYKDLDKKVDFNNPALYRPHAGNAQPKKQKAKGHGKSHGSKHQEPQPAKPPPASNPPHHNPVTPVKQTAQKPKVKPIPKPAPKPQIFTPSFSQSNPNKQCTASSAQCPPGCAMTIKFSPDSKPVPFTAGSGGHSTSTMTQNSCICMNGGSVRVNIGSTDSGSHTSLIEGRAAGLNDNSYFDVSYVEGYSYPVVCWNDNDPSHMSGSNLDLYATGKCTSNGNAKKMGDICENDGYNLLMVGDPAHDCYKCSLPSAFFSPAAGAAYTYPYDDCPCASDPMPGKDYSGPVATGGAITCCVGPDCCANSMSHGGQTKKGNCNRPDCQPCSLDYTWGHCSAACSGKKAKRSFERVFDQHSLRKRRQHEQRQEQQHLQQRDEQQQHHHHHHEK